LIRVYVEGVGLVGPGLSGWTESREILAGARPYVPAATVAAAPRHLPAAEARRTGLPVRLALAAAREAFEHAGRDAAGTPTVFTSSSGDGDNVHEILERLASSDRALSPTRFHNSVHNAAAGYWSIAAASHEPSTSLCGYDESFAAGLVEVASQVAVEGKAVALIAYDHPYPAPLHAKRPLIASFGAAFILTPAPGDRALAALDIHIDDADADALSVADDPALETLRAGVPAARCLPLLAALARNCAEVLALEYVRGSRLRVTVTPCE
jgi:hypothetical protein